MSTHTEPYVTFEDEIDVKAKKPVIKTDHEKRETEDKRKNEGHTCPFYKKKISNRSNLRKRVMTIHRPKKYMSMYPYDGEDLKVCSICGQTGLRSRHDLRFHLRSYHNFYNEPYGRNDAGYEGSDSSVEGHPLQEQQQQALANRERSVSRKIIFMEFIVQSGTETLHQIFK